MGCESEFEVVPRSEADAYPLDGIDKPPVKVVLVVDDEPLIVDSLAVILGTPGVRVLKAYDGASALEVARADPPHLLISDVAMPGMNGIELAMRVAESIPDCQVLLFSGHAMPRDLEKARRAGFNFPLLTKPVHPREMLRHVMSILETSAGRAGSVNG